MATTVHSSQLVDQARVPDAGARLAARFRRHRTELIRTGNKAARPMGVDWDRVRPDQFETIPFLGRLRDQDGSAAG